MARLPGYQQLDSEQLLKRYGPELVADARDVLARHPDMRVGGVIASPDSREAGEIRAMLTKLAGQAPPEGVLLVGIVPRPMIEPALSSHVPDDHWKEPPWQPQAVLPALATTRDGLRFGFLPLGEAEFDRRLRFTAGAPLV